MTTTDHDTCRTYAAWLGRTPEEEDRMGETTETDAPVDANGGRRPSNGYALSLYGVLQRAIRELPGIIERTRAHIAEQQAYLAECERQLAENQDTLAWMLEHQADEIAEIEAHRAKIRQILAESRAAQQQRRADGAGE